MTSAAPYTVRREARSRFIAVRGLRYHVLEWGDAASATPERPPLVLMHGWMDVGASFQFVVDALPTDRYCVALDWRGFGLSEAPVTDTYWIPDYLGDLDVALHELFFDSPDAPQQIDLLGHSLGGNAVMLYAGLRPERVRRLVNLEGFGMPATTPAMAAKRYVQWFDQLRTPATLRPYPTLAAVAQRLRKTNPLLRADRADWLAERWSKELRLADGSSGGWQILADPAHKGMSPTLYKVDEVLACWAQITAPVLWVEGDQTDTARWWGTRYTIAEFHTRLDTVKQVRRETLSPAGHMLHHDQPEALAALLEGFLGG